MRPVRRSTIGLALLIGSVLAAWPAQGISRSNVAEVPCLYAVIIDGHRHEVNTIEHWFKFLQALRTRPHFATFNQGNPFLPLNAAALRNARWVPEDLHARRVELQKSAIGTIYDLLLSRVARLVGRTVGEHSLSVSDEYTHPYVGDAAEDYYLAQFGREPISRARNRRHLHNGNFWAENLLGVFPSLIEMVNERVKAEREGRLAALEERWAKLLIVTLDRLIFGLEANDYGDEWNQRVSREVSASRTCQSTSGACRWKWEDTSGEGGVMIAVERSLLMRRIPRVGGGRVVLFPLNQMAEDNRFTAFLPYLNTHLMSEGSALGGGFVVSDRLGKELLDELISLRNLLLQFTAPPVGDPS